MKSTLPVWQIVDVVLQTQPTGRHSHVYDASQGYSSLTVTVTIGGLLYNIQGTVVRQPRIVTSGNWLP